MSDPPHQLVGQQRRPDPERVVAEAVGSRPRPRLLVGEQRRGQQVVGGRLAPRADVPLVAVLLGEAGLVEPRRHPLGPGLGVGVGLAAAAPPIANSSANARLVLTGSGSGSRWPRSITSTRSRGGCGRPRRSSARQRAPATGPAPAPDRVGGPVLVRLPGGEGEGVEPGGQPVLGAEAGVAHRHEVVAEDVADRAGEPSVAEVDVDVERAGGPARSGSAASTSGRTRVTISVSIVAAEVLGRQQPAQLLGEHRRLRVAAGEHVAHQPVADLPLLQAVVLTWRHGL